MSFKVVMSRRELVAFIFLFSVIETALVLMSFFSEFVLLGAILSILFFAIGFSVIFTTLMFCVKVKNENISVTTRIGKRYSFTCSDIKEVICSKRDSTRYGPKFHITILAVSRQLDFEGTMTGFQKMAEFILEMHANGDIKNNAVSENCRRKLVQYKNGDIFKKKQRNK